MWLQPDDFYGEREQRAWWGIQECVRLGAHPDPILVAGYMREKGEAAPLAYVTKLAEELPDAANGRFYAAKVRKASQRRTMALMALALGTAAKKEADINAVAERHVTQLLGLMDWETRPDAGEAAALLERVVNDGAKRRKEGKNPPGLLWGWRSVDEQVRPLRAGRLYTIAALTGVGKTTFALQLGANVARAGGSVMYVALEQSAEDIAVKLGAQRAGVSAVDLEDWQLGDEAKRSVGEAFNELQQERFLIDGFRAMTIPVLQTRAVQRLRTRGLDLIVVDYLQLMLTSGKTDNRANEVASLSRGLKNLSQTLNVPIVMLSQLGRTFEERKEKNADAEPSLRDLAESSAIEKDSDVVVFLDRVTRARLGESPAVERPTKVIIAKQRHWRTGRAYLDFNGGCCRFEERTSEWSTVSGRDRQGGE
jgi:replicative DNA helicase